MGDIRRFTRIKSSFSQNRRIPRLGKIRLGLKVRKDKGNGQVVEYPRETDYFVCPPEVEAVYGKQPKELDVIFPSDHEETVFPQALAWFGKSKGLKCKGDGETAERLNEQTGEWESMKCPCEHYRSDENPKGECTEQGILMFILPKVSMGGVYQLRTGSYHSVVDVNSGIDYVREMIGRIAMVPLKLKRVPRTTHADGKAQTHYTLSLTMDASIEGINHLRSDTSRILTHKQVLIEGQVEENPALDPPDVTYEAGEVEIDENNQVDAEDLADASEAQMDEVRQKLAGKPPEKQSPEMESGAPSAVAQAKAEPKPKPKPPVNPTSREALKPIDPSLWVDTINAIEEDPDLRDVKEHVKKGMGLPSLQHAKLTGPGQHEFLKRFKEAASKAGFEARLKPIFG